MKKLLAWSIIALACASITHTIYSADNQPGFRIDGLDDLVKQFGDTSTEVITNAIKNTTKNLKDEIIPTLEPALKRAVKESLTESATPILISTAGLIITSAGVMLIYHGIKADSDDASDNAPKKTKTTKLLGYGGALVALGFATIMHTSIRNYFNGPKL